MDAFPAARNMGHMGPGGAPGATSVFPVHSGAACGRHPDPRVLPGYDPTKDIFGGAGKDGISEE